MLDLTGIAPKDKSAASGAGNVGESVRAHAEEVRQRGAAARLRAESIRKTSESLRERGAQREAIRREDLTSRSGTARSAKMTLSELFRKGAELAEQIADVAETYADYLEATAERGNQKHRLELAATEREIAALERRNAKRLREGQRGLHGLEPLPRLAERFSGGQTLSTDSSPTSAPGVRGDAP